MSGCVDVSVHSTVTGVELCIWEPGLALRVEIGGIAVRRRAIRHGGRLVPVDGACGFEPEIVPVLDRLTLNFNLWVHHVGKNAASRRSVIEMTR